MEDKEYKTYIEDYPHLTILTISLCVVNGGTSLELVQQIKEFEKTNKVSNGIISIGEDGYSAWTDIDYQRPRTRKELTVIFERIEENQRIKEERIDKIKSNKEKEELKEYKRLQKKFGGK